MRVRKVQQQIVRSNPTDWEYFRLRLPYRLAKNYTERNGEYAYINIHAPDKFRIDTKGGIPIHILPVRERRGIIFSHFWQITFPKQLAGKIRKGDRVGITVHHNTIHLQFDHNVA